ncbi:MAG: hypothetical protein FI695_00130 [SAR202 cluster bacterium]|nr:hypothetical protein [SAR202 cluster bacterium]|tara:strand:+ start:4496 stop:5023 length:528 start_codon:yes stop_codon:yes gene_type:complete
MLTHSELVLEKNHPAALRFVHEDPVRPELDANYRTSNGREVFSLQISEDPSIHSSMGDHGLYYGENNQYKPGAIICVAYTTEIPKSLDDIEKYSCSPHQINCIAVFYTVWSYQRGAGRKIVFAAAENIKHEYPNVERFITLSPKTEIARTFHLGNNAILLSENLESDNFEYPLHN